MTIRYVGPGGADGNSGLTWALRKLTLNGVEDTPVVAGDIVYCGPGVYRETLTVDVSGTPGNPITYIADVTGENTDDVGGIIRITGSNNDTTITRNYGIDCTTKTYRTFRGFRFDLCGLRAFNGISADNCIIEDFIIDAMAEDGIYLATSMQNFIMRRGHIIVNDIYNFGIYMTHISALNNQGVLIENITIHGGCSNIATAFVGGITVKNCTLMAGNYGVQVVGALAAGQTVDVYNSNILGHYRGVSGTVLGEIIEDYNTFFENNADRENTATGSNSVTYAPLFSPSIFWDGIKYPWTLFELTEWSQISRRYDAYDDVGIMGIYTGVSTLMDDLFGIYRPTGVSLLSWGAIQLREGERETGTKRTGAAAINLNSAGDHQMFVPVTNISTTIEVYVYREAGYEGLAPQMIIRQPGQDDEVVTDTGASGAWNQLTKTLTPAADPPYVCVILRSHNEALAGNFDVFFDDLDVS